MRLSSLSPSLVCPSLVRPSRGVRVPSASAVLARSLSFGAAFGCLRPSARSFSGWVVVVSFRSPLRARVFSRFAARRLGCPFCLVRRAGAFWAVSVPVGVARLPLAAVGSLPCVVVALAG